MTIVELPQGHGRDILDMPLDEAVARLTQWDADFVRQFPQCEPYHRPGWHVRQDPDIATAPWGHVWYIVDAAGLLKLHSANYDSSD